MATPLPSKDKKKRKHWYPIHATQQFQQVKLGEIPAYALQDIVGRVLKINLMTLTNDPKKQAATLHFKITEVSATTGTATLIGYQLNSAHLKRLVRKANEKIEDSFLVMTKDKITYRIKPTFFTRTRTSNSLLTSLRKKAQAFMQQSFASLDSTEAFMAIISNKLQMETKSALKKIYPIAICEIKSFAVTSEPYQQPPQPQQAEVPAAEETPQEPQEVLA